MADEVTTQPDTTASPSEVATPEQQAAPDAQVGGQDASDPSEEGSILGGEVADPVEEASGPPEAYELALEGTELDAEAVAEAEPILRELGLSNEAANKLLPVAASLVSKAADRALQTIVEAGAAQRKTWLEEFKADPEIGGAKQAETEHLAAKGLDALGFAKGHPFRAILTETGFGNHPDMIRAWRKIGEMVGEDGFVRNDAAQTQSDPLTALYPNNRRSK